MPAATPDAARLAAARALMTAGGREESCGPYRLLTDATDARLLTACGRLGRELDAAYEQRFGVRPVGSPGEALVLFRSLRDYRRFVEQEGRLAAGYAGFTSAADGLVALYAETKRSAAVETLAHEMAHLVERRAFGSSLPPWLSEGLADAIGDTATEEGIGALEGTAGVEAIARRLRSGRAAGLARPLAELAALRRSGFDKAVRSYDYEQSALTVRYLLLDPTLGPRFRAYLGDLARAERYDAGRLRERLGRSWEEIERGFAAWLG